MGISLGVQWLRLSTSTARGVGSILGQGIRILHAAQCGKKKKKNSVDVNEKKMADGNSIRRELSFSC